jgi:hypothetical protein
MNTFFILLFEQVYNKDIEKLFKYLHSPFPFSDPITFSQLLLSCKSDHRVLKNYFGIVMLSSYGNWIHNRKKNSIVKSTPFALKYKYFMAQYKNIFISDTEKDNLLTMFFTVQKRYSALNRFAYLWKWKRANVAIDTDLYLNDIESDKSHIFTLYQNNAKFMFSIPQLIRVIETALFHDWEGCFCVNVQWPKNPYNKQLLKAHDLYNIYYYMKYNMCTNIPRFFYLWFLEGFCIVKFSQNNDRLVRKMCIRNYIKNVPNTDKNVYEDAFDMIDDYYRVCNWTIDSDFPKHILVDTMRPYLYLYYLINYDGVSDKQTVQYENILRRALSKFYKQNHAFGRKMINMDKLIGFPQSEFHRKFFNEPKKPVHISFNKEAVEFSSWGL